VSPLTPITWARQFRRESHESKSFCRKAGRSIDAESFRGEDHLRRILEEAQIIVNDALAASPQQLGNAVKTNLKEKP
jgi:hypothetical protein